MEEPKYERLFELAHLLSQQNDFGEILRLVAQKAAELLQAMTAVILMINPHTRKTVKTVVREGRKESFRQYRSLHNQVSGWMIQNDLPFVSENIESDLRITLIKSKELSAKSVVAALLKCEGIVLGSIILLRCKKWPAFDEKDKCYLDKLAVISSPYLRNVQRIAEYFEKPLPEAALRAKYEHAGLLGQSARFVELLTAIEAAVRCDVRVLLEGQTGTGKELVARAIHQFSNRQHQPFVAINCGAIPASLMESELFGHLKGAFTGANRDRQGLFEEANGGVLFLDEISSLTPEMQSKLLRVLEQNEIRPLGSSRLRRIDVRIISAASRPLQELVDNGEFRDDLFYRLHVYPIRVPSLQERREDIPRLAQHFLKRFAQQQNKSLNRIDEKLINILMQQPWIGNIRQFENTIERLTTLVPVEKKVLEYEVLPSDLRKQFDKHAVQPQPQSIAKKLPELVAEYEAGLIRKALAENEWNLSRTARQMGIAVATLHYKIARFKIDKPAQL